MRLIFVIAAALASLARPAEGATLPGLLSPDEVGTVVSELGASGVTRLMRAADEYPQFFPGMKLGLQFDLFFPGNLDQLGAKNGSVPGFIPQPRLYLSKGLFMGLELILSFFPSSVMGTLGSTGFILKWSFYKEEERDLSVAAFAGYTSLSGFSNTYSGTTLETGFYFSKDFVRLVPYMGMAGIHASGEVPQGLASGSNSASALVIHSFLGCEFNFPVNITAQIDLFNITPRMGIFFGKKF